MMFWFNKDCEYEHLSPSVERTVLVHEGSIMCVQNHFETGGEGQPHRHPNEQTAYIVSGKFEFTVDGVTHVLSAGDAVYIKPNVLHGCKCVEKGTLLDVFVPQRVEFLKK